MVNGMIPQLMTIKIIEGICWRWLIMMDQHIQIISLSFDGNDYVEVPFMN